jgi:hypothetical protein
MSGPAGCRDHQPRGIGAQADHLIRRNTRSPERAQDTRAFMLTMTFMDAHHTPATTKNKVEFRSLRSKCWSGILLLMGIAACAQERTALDQQSVLIRLRARVLATVPIDAFNGKLISTSFDPRFAVTLRIQSIDPRVDELVPDAVVTFGIHSPALLFRTEQTKGRSYGFCLQREVLNGKAEFTYFAKLTDNGQCLGSAR